MNIILISIISIIWFSIGYFIGCDKRPKFPYDTKDIASNLQKKLNDKFSSDSNYVGMVARPNAERLDKLRHPERYEGIEETKKAFDTMISREERV